MSFSHLVSHLSFFSLGYYYYVPLEFQIFEFPPGCGALKLVASESSTASLPVDHRNFKSEESIRFNSATTKFKFNKLQTDYTDWLVHSVAKAVMTGEIDGMREIDREKVITIVRKLLFSSRTGHNWRGVLRLLDFVETDYPDEWRELSETLGFNPLDALRCDPTFSVSGTHLNLVTAEISEGRSLLEKLTQLKLVNEAEREEIVKSLIGERNIKKYYSMQDVFNLVEPVLGRGPLLKFFAGQDPRVEEVETQIRKWYSLQSLKAVVECNLKDYYPNNVLQAAGVTRGSFLYDAGTSESKLKLWAHGSSGGGCLFWTLNTIAQREVINRTWGAGSYKIHPDQVNDMLATVAIKEYGVCPWKFTPGRIDEDDNLNSLYRLCPASSGRKEIPFTDLIAKLAQSKLTGYGEVIERAWVISSSATENYVSRSRLLLNLNDIDDENTLSLSRATAFLIAQNHVFGYMIFNNKWIRVDSTIRDWNRDVSEASVHADIVRLAMDKKRVIGIRHRENRHCEQENLDSRCAIS